MSKVGYALDAPGENAVVEQVALDALGTRIEVDRPTVVSQLRVAVNLRRQVVEHRHLLAARQHGVDQVRTDEAGAASNEDVLAHSTASAKAGRARETWTAFGRAVA